MELIKRILLFINDIFTQSWTEFDSLNVFFDRSADVLKIITVIAVVLFIICNPNIRRRKRKEDRIMFWECILVLILILTELSWLIFSFFSVSWINLVYYLYPSISELGYTLIIVQWLIFVDYQLFRSPDHLKRRYRHAALPVFAVTLLDIFQSVMVYAVGGLGDAAFVFLYIAQYIKIAIQFGYIITAIYLVKTYEKENHEPEFLRLQAFIIPFVIGCFIRVYDVSLIAFGIIITYNAVKRRDRFINKDTGFYNRDYLYFLSRFRDKKYYTGEDAILIHAPGNGQRTAGIIKEFFPAGSSIICIDDERFIILSESLRGSAVKMAMMTITEACAEGDDPYVPDIKNLKRNDNETAKEFAERLLNSLDKLPDENDGQTPKGVMP